MRAFIAAPVGERLDATLARRLAPLRQAAPGLRWVPPDRWHLTLRFLGEIDAALVPGLAALLDEVAAIAGEAGAPRLRPAGLSLFPGRRRPRLVALTFRDPPEAAASLVRRLEAGVVRLGLPSEPRPFRPHLTLARLRSPRDARPIEGRLEDGPRRWPALELRSLRLYRSELRPGGPRYTLLHEACLEPESRRPGG